MREVTGSTWTFQMIILFILIFAAFLALVLNYSKAYNIKNRMLTVLEKYEGFTTDSTKVINNYNIQKGYNTKGTCPSDEAWIGAIDLDGTYEVSQNGENYYYCFIERSVNINSVAYVYYDVIVFYRFNLPVLGDLFLYRIKGETKDFVGDNTRIYKKGEY